MQIFLGVLNKMIYKVRRKTRMVFKATLRIIISVQLCYIPYYSYSAEDKSSKLNALEPVPTDISIQNIFNSS